MKTFTNLLSALTLALTVTSGVSHANEPKETEHTKSIIKIVKQDDFVAIPMNLEFSVEQAAEIDRDIARDFDTDYVTAVKYEDALGDFDANIGIVKNSKVKSKIRSGALPRYRNLRTPNSKLGAGLSRKF